LGNFIHDQSSSYVEHRGNVLMVTVELRPSENGANGLHVRDLQLHGISTPTAQEEFVFDLR
jgi:hypothetical protein